MGPVGGALLWTRANRGWLYGATAEGAGESHLKT